MELKTLDYSIIIFFFLTTLFIGLIVARKSGKNTSEYFLSGRNMPWWLLGFSMVATTFSTDTPNLVTDIVRQNGVSGNWVWWAFLLTGLLTVFIYARLWRRSNVNTDMEFYELRYSGKSARFLRMFRSVYLGFIFNILAMSGVTLAAIKIGQVMLGLSAFETVGYAAAVTLIFSALGGFKGVVYSDFLLFFVAMAGAIGASYYCVNLPEVGGIENLMSHPNVKDKLSLIPNIDDKNALITLLIIPLAIQWWSSWYPGAEPGGGGYIAQRMLASKNESHAIGATFFFNIMHYALRPWPWIIVALTSLIVFPDLMSLQEAFPGITEDKLGHDLAYPAMLTKLPTGLLGLVVASLIAAYMSTISTHLNWGASYLVNDVYKQFVDKDASEKKLVSVGRIATVLLMVISTLIALALTNAVQIFKYILMFGAGTGLIFILRWFWWRINAWSEISAMFASGIISILVSISSINKALFGASTDAGFEEGIFPDWFEFPFVVFITSIIWLSVTFLTKPDSDKKLFDFYKKIQPGGPGWKSILNKAKNQNVEIVTDKEKWMVPSGLLAMVLGCVLVYGALFATGNWIYGNVTDASILTVVVLIAAFFLLKLWKRIGKTLVS
ncbi:sodium:solute symporter family protein [Aquimarina sp. 2201CG5-10]|uniref:sodium:solute symporter family protein n=1 Tax=Aquimarina callyspongiae TaxID=3098150 RepID=UPI002AB4857B|nr:sodium:solute symporter family protein [Aquimarina sp. 2201CG5-10]MDY8135134.1 sodium:solute symporter family protein [Aquimarina sp. 2201CG5-10]